MNYDYLPAFCLIYEKDRPGSQREYEPASKTDMILRMDITVIYDCKHWYKTISQSLLYTEYFENITLTYTFLTDAMLTFQE